MDYSLIENREAFNALYWEAQPPAERELRNPMSTSERQTKAIALAQAGGVLVRWIEYYGWEPWATMKYAQEWGVKWLVPLLSDIEAVSFPQPGTRQVSWFGPAPKGSIPVTFDPAFYPPFDPPAIPDPPFSGDPVGEQVAPGVWNCAFGESYGEGKEITNSRGRFVKRVKSSPFGNRAWWEKVA